MNTSKSKGNTKLYSMPSPLEKSTRGIPISGRLTVLSSKTTLTANDYIIIAVHSLCHSRNFHVITLFTCNCANRPIVLPCYVMLF